MADNKRFDIANTIEDISEIEMTEEMYQAYLDYSMAVILDRALPDGRDGLKPVHRRALYAMSELGLQSNKPHRKCARIVGDTLGKYHPHGDGSVYSAMVNIAQDFKTRYPLIDGHGNFGSIDGDGAAAMRYTEARLTKIAEYMLKDIDYKCSDFKPNFDETLTEPIVIPTSIPILLINGTEGVAVGYKTHIPSHNFGEIIDGLVALIKNENIDTRQIMKYIKGPDFAGGGYLINTEDIYQLYDKGAATLHLKAKYKIEEDKSGTSIVITEIPYYVNKTKLLEKIFELTLSKQKKIPNITDLRDESDMNGMRIVIELHRNAIPNLVIEELFKKTDLSTKVSFSMIVIDEKTPKLMSLKQLMKCFIDFRRDVVARKTAYLLKNARYKLEILIGRELAANNIDEIISIIRNSDSTQEAKEALMNRFSLTENQAKDILDIPLKSLTKMESQKIKNDIDVINKEIKNLEDIQNDIDSEIIRELKEVKKLFADERRTEIIEVEESKEESGNTLIAFEPMSVILTNKNTIKVMPTNSLEQMVKEKNAYKERTEIYTQIINCTDIAHDFILILDSGDYIRCNFNDLVLGVDSLLEGRNIVFMFQNDRTEDKYLIIMSKNGIIKKIINQKLISKYKKMSQLIKIDDTDKIICARLSDNNEENVITLLTEDGIIHRFNEKSFTDTAPGGKGLNCIGIENPNIIEFEITTANSDNKNFIVLFTTVGNKKMVLDEFKAKMRMAKGVTAVNFYKKDETTAKIKRMLITDSNFECLDERGNIIKYDLENIPLKSRTDKPEKDERECPFVTKLFL